MRTNRAIGLCGALVLCSLGLASGCASRGELATWWPWYEPDQTADLAKYGPVSRQKVEHLESLREQASAADVAERERVAAELAQQIQNETDPYVRIHIIRTLAQYPTPAADAVLYAALKDPDADVRVECCQAWATRGGADAADFLGETLASDTNVDVRIAAAKALGEMGDPRAVPHLAIALEDPDPALQFRAVAAMRNITGEDLGNDVNAWREYAKNPELKRDESIAGRFRRLF